MKNKRSVYVNFTKLSSYIKKCFKDAYESLELPFNENSIETEYILIEDHDGLFHFYPIFVCDWPQVLKRVEYRLCNNLEKNFGICYGDTNALKATLIQHLRLLLLILMEQ